MKEENNDSRYKNIILRRFIENSKPLVATQQQTKKGIEINIKQCLSKINKIDSKTIQLHQVLYTILIASSEDLLIVM